MEDVKPHHCFSTFLQVHDRCCCHGIMADVTALCLFVLWLMLLPCSVLADVVANSMWKMLNHIIVYQLFCRFMTDVVVMVLWQMLLPYVCLFYG